MSADDGGTRKATGMLNDVNVRLSAEIGRAQLALGDVLKFAPGTIVPLDKETSDPMDVRVNGRLFGRGVVVVVDQRVLGVRLTHVGSEEQEGAAASARGIVIAS